MIRKRSLSSLSAVAVCAAFLTLLFAGCENSETPPAADVSGRWVMVRQANAGVVQNELTHTLVLSQVGDQVSGRVDNDSVSGAVQGYAIEFRGVVADVSMVFAGTVNADGRSMAGTWRRTDNGQGNIWTAEIR